MKTLFRACAVCLFWFGFAHAAVEGDPFSDRPFPICMRLRLPIRSCSEGSRNRATNFP